MPVVPLGGVDHPPQPAEPQPHIRVLEQRERGEAHDDAREHAGVVARQVER